MPTEKELKELKEAYQRYFPNSENKGGKETMSEGEYITKSDLKMAELEKARTNLENALAEQKKQLEDPVISRYLKHKSTCTDEHCIFDLAPNEVYDAGEKAGHSEGYEKGKAEGKKNLTPADLNINLVADWLLERKAMGVVKDRNGQRKIFTGIKTGGK